MQWGLMLHHVTCRPRCLEGHCLTPVGVMCAIVTDHWVIG